MYECSAALVAFTQAFFPPFSGTARPDRRAALGAGGVPCPRQSAQAFAEKLTLGRV